MWVKQPLRKFSGKAPPADSGKGRKRKALMSVDTQEVVTHLFGKKGSMQVPPKNDDVFDDNRSDFNVSCTSGDRSTEGDLEALDLMGSGSTVGGLSSSFSGVPTHSGTVQIEPGNSDEEADAYCKTLSQRPGGVSQGARAAIKDCFANNPRLSLPMGHPVVAFSQEQLCEVMHHTSNESCRDFYYIMKDLLMKAVQLRDERISRRRGPSSISGKLAFIQVLTAVLKSLQTQVESWTWMMLLKRVSV